MVCGNLTLTFAIAPEVSRILRQKRSFDCRKLLAYKTSPKLPSSGNAKKGTGFKEESVGKDPKKSGIPEDDAAKDEAKKQQEQQGMK